MKKTIGLLVFGLLIYFNNVYSQSIEILPSYSLSSENRFKSMIGIGCSFYYELNKKNREVGLILLYNNGYSEHKRDFLTDGSNPQIDHDYRLLKTKSSKFSVRLNYNYGILNTNFFEFHLGPELSYNFIDYTDKIYLLNQDFQNKIDEQLHKIGIGIATSYKFKVFNNPDLSLITKITGTITTYEWGIKSYNWKPWLISWLYVEIGLRYNLTKNE